VTMWSLNWRGWSPDTPCKEYEKLQLVAEDLLAHVGETTSQEQFEQAQKGLLFLWQELRTRMDPLHPRFPGGHRCLDDAYLEYAMRLRSRAVLQKPLPPPAPPQRRQPPRSPDAVVNDIGSLADEIKRPGPTFLGEEQTDDTAPGGNR
jgi:hypothetical protein